MKVSMSLTQEKELYKKLEGIIPSLDTVQIVRNFYLAHGGNPTKVIGKIMQDGKDDKHLLCLAEAMQSKDDIYKRWSMDFYVSLDYKKKSAKLVCGSYKEGEQSELFLDTSSSSTIKLWQGNGPNGSTASREGAEKAFLRWISKVRTQGYEMAPDEFLKKGLN